MAHDDATRDLLLKLTAAEDKHEELAHELGKEIAPRSDGKSGALFQFMLPIGSTDQGRRGTYLD
jgi:rubrerythrin